MTPEMMPEEWGWTPSELAARRKALEARDDAKEVLDTLRRTRYQRWTRMKLEGDDSDELE